jgi:hypothetical protein
VCRSARNKGLVAAGAGATKQGICIHHQDVVRTGRGNLECALRGFLTLHVTEIHVVRGCTLEECRAVHGV